MKNRLAAAIATGLGCGYAPAAPGTAGSLAALLVAWLLVELAGWRQLHLAWLSAAAAALGVWAAGVVARQRGHQDPAVVVADEIVGQWITLVGVTSYNWKSWLLALVLFRLFDIWKPPPVRRLERLPAGVGIVADDVMAGVYGAVVLFLAGCFNLY